MKAVVEAVVAAVVAAVMAAVAVVAARHVLGVPPPAGGVSYVVLGAALAPQAARQDRSAPLV